MWGVMCIECRYLDDMCRYVGVMYTYEHRCREL